jgi:hypothetical protein
MFVENFASKSRIRENPGGQAAQLIYFRDEPFKYHKELILIFLKLMATSMRDKVKSRLKKYFSFNVLLRVLTEDENSFKGSDDNVFNRSTLTGI